MPNWAGYAVRPYLAASWFDVNQLVNFFHHKAKATSENATEPNKEALSSAAPPHPKLEFYTLLSSDKAPAALPHPEFSQKDNHQIKTAEVVEDEPPPLDLELNVASTEPKNPSLHSPEPSSPKPKPALPLVREKPKPKLSSPVKVDYKPLSEKSRTPSLSYSIQIASFRGMNEAAHLKTKMAMKGYKLNIVSVNQQDLRWYRVMLGPFSSLTQARQVQKDFAMREHINGLIR